MPVFSNKTSDCILLLTSQALRVYVAGKDNLFLEETFSTDETGVSGFDRYLDSSPESHFHLVVDLSDEDFRVETVAHVGGKDQKALLERKLQQFFRGNDYRSARIQDRDEGGRRDDRVLFSALTNPDLLAPWIDCLLRRKLRFKGIVSVPMLIEFFARLMVPERLPHLLVVNLEKNGLRQTYMQKGRLKFSRLLSVVDHNDMAEMLLSECIHIRQYLERLKLLPHGQPLQVHVCVAQGIFGGLGGIPASTPLLQFHPHETAMLGAELGVDPMTLQDEGMVHLCLLKAVQAKKLSNVYASLPIIRYHRLRQIRQGLIAGACLILVVALAAGGLLLHEGFDTVHERQRLDQETQRFQSRLEELQASFPETPIEAKEMRAVVDAIENIRGQEIQPMRAMVMVSRALTPFPNIRIQNYEWRLADLSETEEVGGAVQYLGAAGIGDGLGGENPMPVILPRLLAGKTVGIITLSGMVVPSRGYGHAQESLKQLIVALEEIPGLKVIPISMPTETKPDAAVKAKLDDGDILAEFSLKLEYQAPQ